MEPALTDLVWWAESDSIPGWSAAADSLMGLRELIDAAVATQLSSPRELYLDLVVDDPDSDATPAGIEAPRSEYDLPAAIGARSRMTVLPFPHVA